MGNVKAPSIQTRQTYEGEDMVNLCKALNIAVGLIAQMSPMQIGLYQQAKANKQAGISAEQSTSNQLISNSGRIILFTSARARDLDQIQEFMVKSVEKCNNDIEAALQNEQL